MLLGIITPKEDVSIFFQKFDFKLFSVQEDSYLKTIYVINRIDFIIQGRDNRFNLIEIKKPGMIMMKEA